MPVIDGQTYPLAYVQQRTYIKTAQIFRATTPIVRGNPQTVVWAFLVDHCPFYVKSARGLDEAFPVGRVDQDLVFTTEILHFPLSCPVDQGDWIRDVSLREDGARHMNYGRFYMARGNPSFFEAVQGVEQGYLSITASIEVIPPPGVKAIIDALEAEL